MSSRPASAFPVTGLPAWDQDTRRIFLRSLYPHARVVRLAVLLAAPRHFDADLDLVASIASITTRRDLANELTRFRYHPLNRGWLRKILKLRVSTRRLRKLAASRLVAEN